MYVFNVSNHLWYCVRDLTEEQSKVGSAGLVMAIVGGALMPKLQGMIIDAGGNGVADTTH